MNVLVITRGIGVPLVHITIHTVLFNRTPVFTTFTRHPSPFTPFTMLMSPVTPIAFDMTFVLIFGC